MTLRYHHEGFERTSVNGSPRQRIAYPVSERGREPRRGLVLHPGLLKSGWHRVYQLWSFTAVLFSIAFDHLDRRR